MQGGRRRRRGRGSERRKEEAMKEVKEGQEKGEADRL
jgi:hypothetical protein